tara:strand:- start:397 stop:561 length:165 start_codon:yes stop_codon:yes gene_type:complete
MFKVIAISLIIANGDLVLVEDNNMVSCEDLFNKIIKKYENKNHSIVGYICEKGE